MQFGREIKKIYTVNGVDYNNLKEAKAASAKVELVAMFGQEIADKMIENAAKLVPMLYSLKVKKVVNKKVKEVVKAA